VVHVKKLIFGVVAAAVGFIVVRRFAPALERAAMRKCEGMFDRMPDDAPPKRFLRGIDEIRDQNTRILQRLEQDRPIVAVAQ